jgi:hypothetical protein
MATRSMTSVSREDCERLHAELLRLGARGVHRAVPRRLLAETFGSDRRLRHVMAAASGFGYPLGSCGDGYFTFEALHDIDIAEAEIDSRIAELARRKEGYKAIRRTDARFSERLF